MIAPPSEFTASNDCQNATSLRFADKRVQKLQSTSTSSNAMNEDLIAQGSAEACLLEGHRISHAGSQESNSVVRRNNDVTAAITLYTLGLIFQLSKLGLGNKDVSGESTPDTLDGNSIVVDSGFSSSVEEADTEIWFSQRENTGTTINIIKSLTNLFLQSTISPDPQPMSLPYISSPTHKALVDDLVISLGFSHDNLPSPTSFSISVSKKILADFRGSRSRPRPTRTGRSPQRSRDEVESLLQGLVSAQESTCNQELEFPSISVDPELSEMNVFDDDIQASPISSPVDALHRVNEPPSPKVRLPRLNSGESIRRSRTSTLSLFSVPSSRSSSRSAFNRLRRDSVKASSTTSLTSLDKSTLGSFTPVTAKTAVGSLRTFAPTNDGSTVRFMQRVRGRLPMGWTVGAGEVDSDSETESETSFAPPASAPPFMQSFSQEMPIARVHTVPSLSLTHSSFVSSSVMSSCIPSPLKTHHSPVLRLNSKLQGHPRRSQTVPTTPNPPKSPSLSFASLGALPPMDPALAALEKACRLKSKVQCTVCRSIGYDFPRSRTGEALCSKECRVRWKADQAGADQRARSCVRVG